MRNNNIYTLFNELLNDVQSNFDPLQSLSENELLLRDKLISQRKLYDVDDYIYGRQSLLIDKNMEIKIPQTIEDELLMSHDEYVAYLYQKYGEPKVPYFTQNKYVIKNQSVERSAEGLFLHHLAEECRINFDTLMNKDFVEKKPKTLYEPNNFIYCNYFEHLILHIKIALEDLNETDGHGIDIAAAKRIWRELNKFYSTKQTTLKNKAATQLIADRYDDYLKIISLLVFLAYNDSPAAEYFTIEELAQDELGITREPIMSDIIKIIQEAQKCQKMD